MAALPAVLVSGNAEREPTPIGGKDYLVKLRKYLALNISRLAPPPPPRGKPRDATWLQQSYTVFTLGLDPNSAPLSRNLKIPLTLGFGAPLEPQAVRTPKPVLLRLPPDKLLYLLLRWQSLPQQLPHVGRTDVPVPEGVSVGARGAQVDRRLHRSDGDVDSVRSWVGSMRSVSMGSTASAAGFGGWFSKPQEIDEDKLLIELYTVFNTLPALLIHPPFVTDQPVTELLEAGGYTSLGGVDVRVPLDVLRNLQILELQSFDPRGLLIPTNPLLHSLTVRDVEDADEWLVELLVDGEQNGGDGDGGKEAKNGGDGNGRERNSDEVPPNAKPRFPELRHLSLHETSLLSFPLLPLTSLTHLDLSHNLLNSIPDSLSTLHNLVSLDLSSNVITSVRNAPSTLGNVNTLNLARNRLDCLVGLERVPGLRRVDLRGNLLTDPGEVGRLAVLPHIAAVWSAENPFALDGGEWRPDVAAAFVAEHRPKVMFDDIPLTWSEQRRVEAILAARGIALPKNRPATEAASVAHSTTAPKGLPPPSPSRALVPPVQPRPRIPSGPILPPRETASAPGSTLAPPTSAGPPGSGLPKSDPRSVPATPTKVKKRRPKRRVVNLDADDSAPSVPAALAKGLAGRSDVLSESGSGGQSRRGSGSAPAPRNTNGKDTAAVAK